MNQATADVKPVQSQRKAMLGLGLVALLALLAVGLYYLYLANSNPPVRASSKPATAQEIEEAWGIRATQIASTADGGMVDFRYQVVDPDKAIMTEDEATTPVLIDEQSGALINSAAAMAHKHDLHPGVIYFLLYRNTDGAIRPGHPVSVLIGDLRLEHVMVQ